MPRGNGTDARQEQSREQAVTGPQQVKQATGTPEAAVAVEAIAARMSESEIRLYSELLAKSSNVIEFGCGGSTLLAVGTSTIATINSVESDKVWIEKLKGNALIAEAESRGRLHMHHVDIGPTRAWGKPAGKPTPAWRKYYERIWKQADMGKVDLIFVDGRFRVQCALMAAIKTRPKTFVILHDYYSRPYYHKIESFLDYVTKSEDLAVFATRAKVDKAAAQAVIEASPYSPVM